MEAAEETPLRQLGPLDGSCSRGGQGEWGSVSSPVLSLFAHRATPEEIIVIWHLQAAKGRAAASAMCSSPAAEQQHGEAAEEAVSHIGQAKTQSKPPAPQAAGKSSAQDKKKKKNEKEQKPPPAPAKKHLSGAARHGSSPQASHPHAGAAASAAEISSSVGETRAGWGCAQGPVALEGGDPEEAVRTTLGVATEGMGADAAVALVLRTLAFCRDYLLRPDVTACLVNFLGLQLQWLCHWGSSSCYSISADSPPALGEAEIKRAGGSSPRGPNTLQQLGPPCRLEVRRPSIIARPTYGACTRRMPIGDD